MQKNRQCTCAPTSSGDEKQKPTKKRIRLLLVDFDGTLTATHTGGALCFCNDNVTHCLDAETGTVEKEFADNVASGDAEFTLELLMHLVFECGVCVAVITMADDAHRGPRAREHLQTQQKREKYRVLGGELLVRHWLYCLAVGVLSDVNLASAAVERLYQSGRFCVQARFNASSKRSHVANALAHFEANRTLDAGRLQPDEILYLDDSAPLLADMSRYMPKINTAWVPRGITKQQWRTIEQYFTFEDK